MLPPERAGAGIDLGALVFASAVDAARAIRLGDISSVELTTLMLERIRRFNPRLNAIVTLTADAALERAKAADEARARGESWGPFHGVPCTIKDTFEVAGVRTTAGAPAFSGHAPIRDAVVVSRLRAAGAVLLGKTNVPLMAGDFQSFNAIFGVSNNPWDVTRTPGGSTGGGAAALAAGLSFLEPGSDIGGSIRTPAHFCGVYGHKPTLDVVPLRGHIPPPPGVLAGPPTLPVAGPLARSAADLLAALAVLGGPDEAEARAYRWSLPPARRTRLTDYRIGFVVDDPACRVTAEVREVLASTIDSLRKAGVTLEEGWPKGVDPAAQYETYLQLLYSVFTPPNLRDDQLETLRKRAATQDGSHEARQALAFTAGPRHYAVANSRRMTARAAWQAYFRTHDAFLMPTAFVAAFPHDHSEGMTKRRLATAEGPRVYLDMLFWISTATLSGLPATTAPVGLTRGGLPVGMQIVGPYLEDATPIDIAGRLADVVGGFRPPRGFV
ncbi:MAG TPA: amidase [Methylomirabilota bacterium]|nr:amidase [Methylomirabilota bacterium]